jgi:hypothetical protein
LVDLDGGTDEKAVHLRQNSGVTNLYLTDDDTPTSVTGASIAWRVTRSGKTPLTFALPNDNMELRFGAGGDDLAIYHDGTDNHIDSNTGSLKLSGATEILDSSTAPLLINGSINNTYSATIDNDSNGTSNSARFALASGDSSAALFVAGSGRTSTIVTNGPTGAQAVLRTLGDYPVVIGTNNTERMRVDNGLTSITGDLSVSGTITGLDVDDSVRQTSDLVITSNAAYQDTGITVALAAGEYIVTGVTFFGVNATPDGRLRLNFTGTVSYTYGARYSFSSTSATLGGAVVNALPSETAILTLTDEYCHHWIQHLVVTGAGTLSIQAKQNSSSGTAVTFRRGSFLRVVRVA